MRTFESYTNSKAANLTLKKNLGAKSALTDELYKPLRLSSCLCFNKTKLKQSNKPMGSDLNAEVKMIDPNVICDK